MQNTIVSMFVSKARKVSRGIKCIYFFGSRAKGVERPDSDYDLLLVVDDQFSLSDKSRLYDIVMDVLLDSGQLISLKIFKEKEFNRLRALKTPFMTNVLKEGIQVG